MSATATIPRGKGKAPNLVDQVDPARVAELEAEGLDHSDALGAAMAEAMAPEPAYAAVPLVAIDVEDNVRADVGDVEELAASIRELGVLEPVKVRARGDRFLLVFGHRRLAAAKAAGLKAIPAIVDHRPQPPARRTVEQLVENLQREDLNALEEARALRAILDAEKGLSQAELARRLGRSQPWIANTLALIRQPVAVQEAIASGRVSLAHAKAVNGLPEAAQERLIKAAASGNYPAHQTEADARWERQQQDRTAKARKASEAGGARAVKALAAAKVGKRTPVQVSVPWDLDAAVVRAAIQAAGWTLLDGWATRPEKACDCKAVTVLVQDGNGSTVEPACVSDEHRNAGQAERDRRYAEAAKQQARDEAALNEAIVASLRDRPLHPTMLRLLARALAGYTGDAWGTFAKASDEDLIADVARRMTRSGTTWGKPIPVAKVVAELAGPPAKRGRKAAGA